MPKTVTETLAAWRAYTHAEAVVEPCRLKTFGSLFPPATRTSSGVIALVAGSCTSTVTVLGVNRGIPATVCGCSVS